MNKYNGISKITAVICLISLIFTSCGNSVPPIAEYVLPDFSDRAYHRAEASDYSVVSSSGLIELLFDKETATAAIRDKNSGFLWTTLPSDSVEKEITSYALEVTLSDSSGKAYILNSQDNSVAHGNFTYTSSVDGIAVTYSLALDKETGNKAVGDVSADTIRADITILYTLSDGSFYVNVSMNSVILPESIKLESIKLLNNFGAYEVSGSEDYIFVPDGSGAIIKTGTPDEDFRPLSLPVYKNGQCLLGAFGMKHGENAFLCIIEQGDSIAVINAHRNGETSLNCVNAEFNVKNEYKNEIKLCYRFLSGKSATYSGMATACRENLIRNNILSTKSVDTEAGHLPMIITLQGGYRNENNKYTVLSGYSQALSLMSLLKAKGVNNAYLRYNGLYNGANNGSSDKFDDFKKALGTKKEFNELYSYLNSQKFALFIDTDILTVKYSLNGAVSSDGEIIRLEPGESFPEPTSAQTRLKISNLEKRVEQILRYSENVDFDGYALNDIGVDLYSDYSRKSYPEYAAHREIASQVPVLSASKMLMIDTGNFYAVKNADVITEIPVSAVSREESEAYRAIPFVQMLLHGIYEYSASGLNTADDTKTAFLKSVEYGCLPGAYWYCTGYNEETDEKFYYDKNINDMVSYYIKADMALSALRDARMTSHYQIQDGVYCTEYDNSIKVYVNYTDSTVTVNGVIVEAKDCITIS